MGSLVTQIPRRSRYANLAKSDDVVVQALLNKPLGQQERRKHSRIYKLGNVEILSKESEKQAWKKKIHRSGLIYHSKMGQQWLTDPIYPQTGKEFVNCIYVQRCQRGQQEATGVIPSVSGTDRLQTAPTSARPARLHMVLECYTTTKS